MGLMGDGTRMNADEADFRGLGGRTGNGQRSPGRLFKVLCRAVQKTVSIRGYLSKIGQRLPGCVRCTGPTAVLDCVGCTKPHLAVQC